MERKGPAARADNETAVAGGDHDARWDRELEDKRQKRGERAQAPWPQQAPASQHAQAFTTRRRRDEQAK
jgi:hypothetical protein